MYVAQCMAGKEAQVRNKIFSQSQGRYVACFPTTVLLERCGGKWLDRLRVLMPGYVFVDTPMNNEVYHGVKAVDGVIRWLDPGQPTPLTEGETAFIRRLTANNRPVAPIDIETSPHLKIQSGPLAGFEHKIVDFNRRQRRAYICATVLGKEHTFSIGAHFRETPVEGH